MITVKLFSVTDGNINCYQIEGHAGCGKKGKDIVCAAVSVIAQTTAMGLIKVIGLKPVLEMHDGYFSCQLPNDLSPNQKELTGVLIDTMIVGLEETAREYPGCINIIKS